MYRSVETTHSTTVQIYDSIEGMVAMTSPQSFGHHSTPKSYDCDPAIQ